MSPLLFCHLLAARSDAQQPMAKLATEYPELLSDIAKLRRWRNPIDHGDAASIRNEISSEQVEFMYQLVGRVREILSGWLKDNNNRIPEETVPNWFKDDIRSEASHKLDKHFGLMRSRMSELVYQGLFDALVFANLEDARDRANKLAGALQHALYQACQSLNANEAKDIEYVKRQLADLMLNKLPRVIHTKFNRYSMAEMRALEQTSSLFGRKSLTNSRKNFNLLRLKRWIDWIR